MNRFVAGEGAGSKREGVVMNSSDIQLSTALALTPTNFASSPRRLDKPRM